MEPIDRTGEFYVCYCRKDVHIFVQDVNPGQGSKTVFLRSRMAFKSSNVSISTQCFTRAWLSLYCHGYTREWAI